MTTTTTVFSAPTAPTTSSPSASSGHTGTSNTHRTTLIFAITLPLILLIVLAVLIAVFLRRRRARRALNARHARDLERRADWLDPAYTARIRAQMTAMDPTKVDPTHGTAATNETDVMELPVWNDSQQQQRRANDLNADEITVWTNRGNMSGSLGSRVQEEQSDETQVPSASRPLPGVLRARTRTATTEEGSPVLVPYEFGRNGSGSLDRRGDSNVDLSLQRAMWSPLDGGQQHHQQYPSYHRPDYATGARLKDSPPEGEWLSNSDGKSKEKEKSHSETSLDASNNASKHDLSSPTITNMDIPPPLFDPRGAIVRESQIGLALPFPSPEEKNAAHEEGKLTGDGYESLWRSRRRGRAGDRARPRGGVWEDLPGLEVGESSSAAAEVKELRTQRSEDSAAMGDSGTRVLVDTRPPMEVSMVYPLLAGSERQGLSYEQRMAAVRSKLDLLSSVRQRTAADDEEDRRKEEAERERVAASAGEQGGQEQQQRVEGPLAADGVAVVTRTEGGNEEIVKAMLAERFGWVKRLFGGW